MGYKLADGSDIFDYAVGETFKCKGFLNEIVYSGFGRGFSVDGPEAFMICQNSMRWLISSLTPTEETKRKVAERNQPKCKCGYVIPVMEISGGDLGSVENMLASVFNLGEKKPQDVPEIIPPLARIIDWRGGEPHKPTDIAVNDNGDTATMLSIHQSLGKLGWNTLIRINTAAIPKLRTMTKAEVEREFSVKVVG